MIVAGTRLFCSVTITSPGCISTKSRRVMVVSASTAVTESPAWSRFRSIRAVTAFEASVRDTANQLWLLNSAITGSITLYGIHRFIVPARVPIRSSSPITITTSFGGTIWTSCGFDSSATTLNFIGRTDSHASPSEERPRVMTLEISRCSMWVMGRWGMNRSWLVPPSKRSMMG